MNKKINNQIQIKIKNKINNNLMIKILIEKEENQKIFFYLLKHNQSLILENKKVVIFGILENSLKSQNNRKLLILKNN
jgi:hypothetical protein